MGTKANIWMMWAFLGCSLFEVVDLVRYRDGAWGIHLAFLGLFVVLAGNRWMAHRMQQYVAGLHDLVGKQNELILMQRATIAELDQAIRKAHRPHAATSPVELS